MTSPPYWGLRDYGVAGQLGLERDFGEYLNKLAEVFREVKRVLKPTGTCWVNLGDTYAGSWGNYSRKSSTAKETAGAGAAIDRAGSPSSNLRPPSSHATGIRKKSLCMVPERFALDMMAMGWILRNKVIWHKPNPVPSSVKDRFTNSWEYLFLFSKAPRYYFDLDAVRAPHKKESIRRTKGVWDGHREPGCSWHGVDSNQMCHPLGKNPGDFMETTGILSRSTAGLYCAGPRRNALHWAGKNPGDCWTIGTQPFRGAHFATFPEKLVRQAILTSPQRNCVRCDKGWGRSLPGSIRARNPIKAMRDQPNDAAKNRTACSCKAGFRRAIILDPFMGSGTTAVVAKKLGRDYIGFELNAAYAKLARKRVKAVEASNEALKEAS